MKKSYRSELVGVFGDPIDQNATIVMEEAAFRELGLDFRYIVFKVRPEDLEAGVEALRALNMRGINLTAPHKILAMEYLDSMSEAAKIIGAVNTIVAEDGKLHGENTDGKGFVKSLVDAQVDIAGKTVDILGAGGAARALAVELALAGAAQVNIINRNVERGEELRDRIRKYTKSRSEYIPWNEPYHIPGETDMIVNCTTVGMDPHPEQLPNVVCDSMRPDMLVCDAVASPPRTLFLQEAEKRGAGTIDGLGWLINQGAVNFTLWTGREAPIETMTKAIRAEYGLD